MVLIVEGVRLLVGSSNPTVQIGIVLATMALTYAGLFLTQDTDPTRQRDQQWRARSGPESSAHRGGGRTCSSGARSSAYRSGCMISRYGIRAYVFTRVFEQRNSGIAAPLRA